MCTVTWWKKPTAYELFFNRDELKTRQEALPPEMFEENGVRFIAPVDGDFGGTWIFVNQYGLTVGLLNHYPACVAQKKDGLFTSRGLLVRSLADCPGLEALAERLVELDLKCYRPFHLVALQLGREARMWTWDGQQLDCDCEVDAALPVTTSSYASADVVAERKNEFRSRLDTGETFSPQFLENFHKAHAPERGAFSVCMEREDAETVSLSRVRVEPEKIMFTYSPKVRGEPDFGSPVIVAMEPERSLV